MHSCQSRDLDIRDFHAVDGPHFSFANVILSLFLNERLSLSLSLSLFSSQLSSAEDVDVRAVVRVTRL